VQGSGHFLIGVMHTFGWWLFATALLGVGTAMVYPTLIAAVSDTSHPSWRARSLSVYRFWRDLGYAIGALSAGLIADTLGLAWSIRIIAALSFLSGAVVAMVMREPRSGRP
jgi:MFS family permease